MAVLTVGKIESEGAWNIIPNKASLISGVRTLDYQMIQEIRDRMKEIAEGIGKSMRSNIIFDALIGAPPVVNDEELTKKAIQSIEMTIGKENIMLIDPVIPSEDFSWYQKAAPGVFFFLGIGDETKETDYAQHHPKYKVDDDALSNGVAAILSVTFDFINN
jgi:amidohydrolase